MRFAPLAVFVSLSVAPAAFAAPADPGPSAPLQTPNTKFDPAWMLQGWTANILGVQADPGKTQLVVEGEAGYTVTADIEGKPATQANPAKFELSNKDYRIVVKVTEPRGSEWQETVDVPKGMKVTVQIKARYEHRGFEGTIKNDTMSCRNKGERAWHRYEIFQNGQQVGNAIDLEPGKSAPGVLLKIGTYDLRISDKGGSGWVQSKSEKLDVKEQQWRYETTCSK